MAHTVILTTYTDDVKILALTTQSTLALTVLIMTLTLTLALVPTLTPTLAQGLSAKALTLDRRTVITSTGTNASAIHTITISTRENDCHH